MVTRRCPPALPRPAREPPVTVPGRATPQNACDPDFGKGERYPVSICSTLNPPLPIIEGMSRVTWHPSNAHLNKGLNRSCQRRTRGSGESPCSKKISRPPGSSTGPISRMASATPRIVHSVMPPQAIVGTRTSADKDVFRGMIRQRSSVPKAGPDLEASSRSSEPRA
jgi:hypothetical protein